MAVGSAKAERFEATYTVIIAADGQSEAGRSGRDIVQSLIGRDDVVNVRSQVPMFRPDLTGKWPERKRERRLR